jgi:hypothetical protein
MPLAVCLFEGSRSTTAHTSATTNPQLNTNANPPHNTISDKEFITVRT